jgi:glycosyltransferase involved in cell wall biosynthesis
MVKVGMLSTWNEVCGVARNAHSVADMLEDIVEIVPLPLKRNVMLSNENSVERKLADKYFKNLLGQANKCDYLIWQHEPGLLGINRLDYLKRSRQISKLNIRIIVVLHTIPRGGGALDSFLKGLVKLPFFIRKSARYEIREKLIDSARALAWKVLFRDLKRIQNKGGQIIIHNDSDATYLLEAAKLNPKSIVIAPPSNLTNEMHEVIESPLEYMRKKSGNISRIQKVFANDPDGFYISYVGFINDYKGIDYLLSLLELLPENYYVLIAGGIHERSADNFVDAHPFTQKLLESLGINLDHSWDRKPKLKKNSVVNNTIKFNASILNRVVLISNPTDGEIAESVVGSDAIALLYRNVQQSASGPLVETLELGGTCIASNNKLFRTFRDVAGQQMHLVDVGNVIQAKQTLLSLGSLREIRDDGGVRNVSYAWTKRLEIKKLFAAGYAKCFEDFGEVEISSKIESRYSI